MSASINGASPRFSPAFLDELRARYPLASAVQQTVKLKRAGSNRWKGCCPFHAEKTPSFTVYPDRFKCFGCGASGDVFAFVEGRHGLKFPEAVEHVASAAGVPMPDTHAPRTPPPPSHPQPTAKAKATTGDSWHPIVPPPAGASPPSARDLRCTSLHEYRGSAGELLFYVRRVERADGKAFVPLSYGNLDGIAGWHSRAPGGLRPLYGLDRLAARPQAPVLVCEGEKAAEAAQKLFPGHVCMSWMGGAAAVEKADWTPLVGRRCTIWPDNDAAGREAAAKIATLLPGSPVLRVDDLGAGHDAADLRTDDPGAWLRDHLPPPDPIAETPLPLIWLDEIEPVLRAQDFVQGLLMEGGAAVVYGESNSGKTFWTTDLALHVAAGKPWNGRRVDQGGVVYAVLEGGNGFRNRAAAWRQANTEPGDKLPFAAIPAAINLCDPDADTAKLIETVQAAGQAMGQPVKLIVIDTLSRAMAGGNENAADDMGALVANMDRIRAETGACLLFVHHCGKDAAKGARGHSSLRAAVDSEIEVTAGGSVRMATVVKQRDMAKGSAFGFQLETVILGQNQHGEDVTTCLVAEAAAVDPGAAKRGREAKLRNHAATALHTLRNLDPALFETVQPNRDMAFVTAINRKSCRAILIREGWFSEGQLLETPNGAKASKSGLTFENNQLTALKRHGFLNFNQEWIWLL